MALLFILLILFRLQIYITDPLIFLRGVYKVFLHFALNLNTCFRHRSRCILWILSFYSFQRYLTFTLYLFRCLFNNLLLSACLRNRVSETWILFPYCFLPSPTFPIHTSRLSCIMPWNFMSLSLERFYLKVFCFNSGGVELRHFITDSLLLFYNIL